MQSEEPEDRLESVACHEHPELPWGVVQKGSQCRRSSAGRPWEDRSESHCQPGPNGYAGLYHPGGTAGRPPGHGLAVWPPERVKEPLLVPLYRLEHQVGKTGQGPGITVIPGSGITPNTERARSASCSSPQTCSCMVLPMSTDGNTIFPAWGQKAWAIFDSPFSHPALTPSGNPVTSTFKGIQISHLQYFPPGPCVPASMPLSSLLNTATQVSLKALSGAYLVAQW